MNRIKKNLYLTAIPISMVLSSISLGSVQANTSDSSVRAHKAPILISQLFEAGRRKGAPESTSDGASRSGFTPKKENLISLIPKEQGGLTFDERPTFYWHISEIDANEATFILVDENEDVIYEKGITLPEKPGYFAFTLPGEAPGLKVDKQYRWFLEVSNSSRIDDIVTVKGWVKRTKPSLAVQMKLNKLEAKHRSQVYADAGIWHNAIDNVAQQRCIAPNDSTTTLYWNQLLTSVGLNQIVSESMNNVCTVES